MCCPASVCWSCMASPAPGAACSVSGSALWPPGHYLVFLRAQAHACLMELSTWTTHTSLGLLLPSLVPRTEASVALPGSIFCSHGGPEGRSLSPLSFSHACRRKRVFPKRSLLCLGSLHMWPRTFIFNKGIQNGTWGGGSFGRGGWNLGMQSVRPCRVWDGGERRAEDSRQAPFLLQVAPKNVEEAEGLNSSVGL